MKTAGEIINVTHRTGTGTGFGLMFPVSELGHAIALCGWMLANEITKTDAVRAEIARLESSGSLPIPDARAWFATYATPF